MSTRKPFPSVCKYLEDGQPVGEVHLTSKVQKISSKNYLRVARLCLTIMESTSPVMVPTGDIYILLCILLRHNTCANTLSNTVHFSIDCEWVRTRGHE